MGDSEQWRVTGDDINVALSGNGWWPSVCDLLSLAVIMFGNEG